MQKNIVSVMLTLVVAFSLQGQERESSPSSPLREKVQLSPQRLYAVQCEVENDIFVLHILDPKNNDINTITLDLHGDRLLGLIDNKSLPQHVNNNLLSLFSIDENWKKDDFFYNNKATITSSDRDKIFMIIRQLAIPEGKVYFRKPTARKLQFGDGESLLSVSNSNFSLSFD